MVIIAEASVTCCYPDVNRCLFCFPLLKRFDDTPLETRDCRLDSNTYPVIPLSTPPEGAGWSLDFQGYCSGQASPDGVCILNHLPSIPQASPSLFPAVIWKLSSIEWPRPSNGSSTSSLLASITVPVLNVSLCLPLSSSRGHFSHSHDIPDMLHLHTHRNIFPLLGNVQFSSLQGSRLSFSAKKASLGFSQFLHETRVAWNTETHQPSNYRIPIPRVIESLVVFWL